MELSFVIQRAIQQASLLFCMSVLFSLFGMSQRTSSAWHGMAGQGNSKRNFWETLLQGGICTENHVSRNELRELTWACMGLGLRETKVSLQMCMMN